LGDILNKYKVRKCVNNTYMEFVFIFHGP